MCSQTFIAAIVQHVHDLLSQELLDLLLNDKDVSTLLELLEDYKALHIADWTESLDFDAWQRLRNMSKSLSLAMFGYFGHSSPNVPQTWR